MPIQMPEKKQRPVFRPLHTLALLLLAGFAAVYWHFSGQVRLRGEVKDSVISISPGLSGVFSRIGVREGQRVGKGQPLVLLDRTAQQRGLAEERQKLAQFEALLPPRHARAAEGRLQDEESLEERLLRQRETEEEADRRLQKATEDEAMASVTYNRASMLASQGRLPPRERDAAALALDEARRATRAARESFEFYSQARSGTTAEMRRVKENQSATGADSLPADLRIRNYELQRERVRAAEAALEATVVRAPEDGVITEITAKPGGPATAGSPCLYMASYDKSAIIVARASDDAAKKLRLGQQCRLEIAGAPDNPYAGHISAFLPGITAAGDTENAPSSGRRVRITLSATAGRAKAEEEADAADEPALYLNGGAGVEVTVLLRAPLYARGPAASRGDLPGTGREGAGGSAPASPPPLPAVPANTPAVTAPPPSVPAPASPVAAPAPANSPPDAPVTTAPASGPPAKPAGEQSLPESGGAGPRLPPMRAPEHLTGNTLPDPGNNPSLVTPEILDREGRDER